MSEPVAAQGDVTIPQSPVRAPDGAAWGSGLRAGAFLLILLAGWLAYANSLDGAFVFDDRDFSESPRGLSWRGVGGALKGARPVVELSMMANYSLGGLDVRGYHIFNITVHLLAGCVLFALMRRLLRAPGLAGRYGAAADGLALATALLWTVHPVQTQAVTYIIQRAESMAGLFYLLTLYCAVRGFEAMDAAGQRARPVGVRWGVAAALCCAAGMATKPVMATAPVMVLALDYLFFSLSWKQALRRRWVLYAGLAATWLVLLPTTVMQSHESSAGFGYRAITPWEYACTQPRAVLWYVRLALWPDALCFDYMRPPLREWGRVIVPAAAVVLALGVTVWLLARRRPAAMFGVWFFLILSVTSSVMPIADVCVEHRVYLSLAAIIAAAVIGGYEAGGWLLRRVARRPESRARWGRALAWGAVALAAVALGWRTHERNRDYRSEAALWESVLRARPDNLRAKLNYGYALFVEGRTEEAIGMTQAPAQAGDPAAHLNLGRFYSASGRAREAEAAYRKALELDPGFAKAHYNLGNLLLQQGRVPEAAGEFAVAARLRPEWAAAHNNLGIALARMNDLKGAEERFRRALALDPGYAAARENLARVLGLTGRGAAPGSGQ